MSFWRFHTVIFLTLEGVVIIRKNSTPFHPHPVSVIGL